MEKEQIQKTIEAETQAKVAEFNLMEERKKYEVAQFKAKSKIVSADASYYENLKLVQAGLSPQDKARINKEIAIGVAEKISQLKLPQIYITGQNDKSNGSILQDLLGAELAKKMLVND